MSSLSKSPGRVSVVISHRDAMEADIFGSTKEMVQHYLAQTALVGSWGDEVHLEALKETHELLGRVIQDVEREVERERAENPACCRDPENWHYEVIGGMPVTRDDGQGNRLYTVECQGCKRIKKVSKLVLKGTSR